MNEADILANAMTEEEYSLDRLQYWLQYGKHSWSVGAGIIWFSYGLILTIVKILAIIFTPYMLWHLFKAKWYKSIVVFLIIVIMPFVVFQSLPVKNHILYFVFMVLPIVSFYFYTYIISYMIGEYLNDIKTLKKWKIEEELKKSY